MFADDTNLFLDINKLFNDIKLSYKKMSIWLETNKLSLDLTKMTWALFHSKKTCLIANYLPILYIGNFQFVRKGLTKFLGISINKNLT